MAADEFPAPFFRREGGDAAAAAEAAPVPPPIWYPGGQSAASSPLHLNDWSNDEGSTRDGAPDLPRRPLDDFSRGASTLSGSGTTLTGGSRLIKDLIWIEARIAAQKTPYGPGGVPRGTAPPDDGGGPDAAPQHGHRPSPSRLKCPDIVAPPGTRDVDFIDTQDGPMVHAVERESPVAGRLLPGDLVIAVNGMDTRKMSAQDVQALIGSEGRERRITVVRSGGVQG